MSNIMAVTYEGSLAVTASDTADDPAGPFAGLLVTATGNVTYIDNRGATVTQSGLAANAIIPIMVKRVKASGLTATVRGLVAMPVKGNGG